MARAAGGRGPMSPDLGSRLLRGFMHVSLRQGAGMLVSAAGSIVLARYLGAELLGMHAVATFFCGIFALLLELGTGQYLIRVPKEQLDDSLIATVFSLRIVLALVLAAAGVLVAAPALATAYETRQLYWLVASSTAALAVASPFRISMALLEKDLDYAKVGVIELLALIAFFGPAGTLAAAGFGIWALVAGETARGLVPIASCWFKPFTPRLRVSRQVLREIVRFGTGYVSGAIAWGFNNGLNPLVVGKLVGLEAAGIVRVAEGLAGQATLFRSVADRVVLPALAEMQQEPDRVVRFLREWRAKQLLLGVLPLMALTAISPWLVPLLYGRAWTPVADVLLLLCLSTGVSVICGPFTSGLIARGLTWDTTRFHAAYAVVLWCLAPLLVARLGLLGYPAALVAVTPLYALVYQRFASAFAPLPNGALILAVVGCWLATAFSWSRPAPLQSAILFVVLVGAVCGAVPDVRQALAHAWTLLRKRSG